MPGSHGWPGREEPPDCGKALQDHMAGGTAGGPWKQAQAPQPNVAMYQYGYNQVFEQIFQAFEQKYDDADRAEFHQESYILPNRATYEWVLAPMASHDLLSVCPRTEVLLPLPWACCPFIRLTWCPCASERVPCFQPLNSVLK